MGAITSPQGHGLSFTGFTLGVGNGASPQVFTAVANVTSFKLPTTTIMVDNTNSSDQWVSRQPVIADMGKIQLGVEYQPADTSMYNGANGGSVAGGMRYLLIQRTLTNWQAQYPQGSVDEWPGYVTDFSIDSKVKDIFHASLEITNSGAPVLC